MQMPMNSVSKHPKLKLDLVLNSTVFEAGGTISGKLELTCTTSQKLRLGEISVELEGIEELTSRDHAASQLFLYNRTMFQGEHLPPSNAVLPAAPNNGYWTARKGRTTFPFSFRLPSTAPSCVTFAGNASLRYHLKATAQTWWQEEKMLVTARREAFVIEKWSDEYDEKYQQPVEAVGDTRLFMGGNGAIWLEAGVTEQLFWGGGQILIRCGIKNNTKRQVSGIKVCLARRLIFPVGSADGTHDRPNENSLEPRITEMVHEQLFKGREYEFAPNQEAVCTVAVDVPRDLRTVRKTRLFEVRTYALVSLVLGSFAKDLTVEIPIYVAHTASVQRPAQEDLQALHPRPGPNHAPERPHSSAGHAANHHHHHHHHAHHHGHPQDQQMLEVERYGAERGWSPAPTLPGQMPGFAPSRPASTAPGLIQLPNSPQPFSVAPTSPGQLEWNPMAAGWSASQIWNPANAGAQIARSASAAPIVGPPPRAVAATPEPDAQYQQYQPQQQQLMPHTAYAVPPAQYGAQPWQAPQRSVSASPGPMPAGSGTPDHLMALPSHGRAPTAGSTHLLQQQARRASLPAPGAHGSGFAIPVIPPDSPAGHPMQMPETQFAEAPAAPEQHQLQIDTNVSHFNGPPTGPLAGLATIEEDGESQAGTVKSVHALGTLNKPSGGTKAVNSVSKNDIDQFEAIARAEEDEEEVKRQMRSMGMVPDDASFHAPSQTPVSRSEAPMKPQEPAPQRSRTPTQAPQQQAMARAKENESLPKPPVPSSKSNTASVSSRPRASDIFAVAQRARDEGEDAQAAVAALEQHSRVLANVGRGEESGQAARSPSALTVTADASRSPHLERRRSSAGLGLDALETKLSRSTTPKLPTSPPPPASPSVMVMANVGRREEVSSPISSGSTRSRKESALRAAAVAREAVKREQAEREEREAVERKTRFEQEERQRREEAIRAEAAARARREEEAARETQRRAQQAKEEEERRRQEQQQREIELQKQRQQEEEERKRRQQQREAEEVRLQAEAMAKEQQEAAAAWAKPRSSLNSNTRAASVASARPVATQSDSTPVTQHGVLKKEAVSRVTGWLSSSSSPNNSHLEKPGTPSGSVISLLQKDDPKSESKMIFPSRSPSQVRNPLWTESESRSGMSKSHTVANLVREEPLPTLSAELRALVDSSEIVPARRAGTALRDHPISRKISTSSQANVPAPAPAPVSDSTFKRSRHTSLPAWPKPGLPSFGTGVRPLPGVNTLEQSSSPVAERSNPLGRRPSDIFSAEDKEIVVPSRVEKTLIRPSETPSYDSRSARGGRGGRVTSVTQLWANIAGDTEPEATAAASQPPSGTFKPKARRGSAIGGAPALDFSKKKASASTSTGAVNAIAASFGSGSASASKPESLKSNSAPQFLNTSVPKPVFSSAAANPRRPLPQPQPQPQVQVQVQIQAHQGLSSASIRSERRISTDFLNTFEKQDLAPTAAAAPGEFKFSGRGTTKAIGQEKLRDLKAIWGS